MDEEPVTSEALPVRVIPAARSMQSISPAPATTGVPANNPVNAATSGVISPITVELVLISGNFSTSMPTCFTSSEDQSLVTASIKNAPDASDQSVATVPVKRKLIKSFGSMNFQAR